MRLIWAAGIVVSATTAGCVLFGGLATLVAKPNKSLGNAPSTTASNLSLEGQLSIPANLTQVTPLNNSTPLVNTSPLNNSTPLVGNAGAGLIGNAGAGLVGNAGAGFRVLAPSRARFPEADVELINPSTGLVLTNAKTVSGKYAFRFNPPGNTGLIVQAFFRNGSDVIGFLASPAEVPNANPTLSATASVDLNLGTTLATFTIARMAGVSETELKLDVGFKGIKKAELGKLASETGENAGFPEATKLVLTSDSFEAVLGTAGSLSRAVATAAASKAMDAGSTTAGAKAGDNKNKVAAIKGLLKTMTEVVETEKTLANALARANTEVQAQDVVLAAKPAEAVRAPGLEVLPDVNAILAVAVEPMRPALVCVGKLPLAGWVRGGRVQFRQYNGKKVTDVANGKFPVAERFFEGALVVAPTETGLGFGVLTASLTKGGSGDHLGLPHPPQRAAAAVGGRSALIAFDTSEGIAAITAGPNNSEATGDFGVDTPLLASNSQSVSNKNVDARRPAVAAVGSQFLVVWDQAGQRGGRQLIGRFLNADGLPEGDQFEVGQTDETLLRVNPAVATGTNKLLVAWTQSRFGSSDIAGALLNFEGRTLGTLTLADGPFDQRNPALTWTGTNFIVAWDDRQSDEASRLIGARSLTQEGQSGIEHLLKGDDPAMLPALTSCDGRVYLAWIEGRSEQSVRAIGLKVR